jgi:hypothetical protein
MRRLNVTAFIWLVAAVSVGAWLATLGIRNIPIGISLASIKVVPTVVTIEGIVWWLFVRWGWKAKVLQGWFVRIPAIDGRWSGSLQSTWLDPATGQGIPDVPVEVEIKQTFDSVTCKVRSGEMTSQSTCAEFTEDPDGTVRLVYTYVSVPRSTVRDRSPMHYGTAMLTLATQGSDSLEGAYWTDRKTTGQMHLVKVAAVEGAPAGIAGAPIVNS